jgi:8-oxo-dGTP pyrophosphatase MutT (NUDIX family)
VAVSGGPSSADAGALDLEQVRSRLARYRPDVRGEPAPDDWQAATAVVIARGPTNLEVAFIRRTTRRGDRWSGDMALPGGTREAGDVDLAATAARETFEEVGLVLDTPIGRLDDQRGRTRRGVVASFVHTLDHRPPLLPDPREVAEALWIPLPRLYDPATASRHRWSGIPFPAVEHEGRVIWGLTHRILESLGRALHLTG